MLTVCLLVILHIFVESNLSIRVWVMFFLVVAYICKIAQIPNTLVGKDRTLGTLRTLNSIIYQD